MREDWALVVGEQSYIEAGGTREPDCTHVRGVTPSSPGVRNDLAANTLSRDDR